MALAGRATTAGTAGFAAVRQLGASPPAATASHFRLLDDLTISSVGFGLAAGEPTDEVDARYRAAIVAAIEGGCNHFDVAPSYRGQRSETALGQTLAELVVAGRVRRDELIIASKAGFIPYTTSASTDATQYVYDHFVAPGIAEPDDLAGGIHCMAPDFIGQQISWSLRNIGLRTLDIFYLQNPETQLSFVDRAMFRRRLQLAFARLEEEVAAGRIGCYGIATWEGFRLAPLSSNYMSLEVTRRLAMDVAGADHHLRVVQLPLSGAMLEAMTLRNQPVKNSILPMLAAARDLGFAVIASAALGQGQTPARLRETMSDSFPALETDSQRSLHFIRSLPGVASALFGSTNVEHVRENLVVSSWPPDPLTALRLAHMKGR